MTAAIKTPRRLLLRRVSRSLLYLWSRSSPKEWFAQLLRTCRRDTSAMTSSRSFKLNAGLTKMACHLNRQLLLLMRSETSLKNMGALRTFRSSKILSNQLWSDCIPLFQLMSPSDCQKMTRRKPSLKVKSWLNAFLRSVRAPNWRKYTNSTKYKLFEKLLSQIKIASGS